MRLLLVAAAAIVALAGAAVTLTPRQMTGACIVAHGPAMVAEVPEASGLAVSRRHPGVVWMHNDSGNAPLLFAVDRDGGVLGRVRLPMRTRDWEDVTAVRCPAGDCLYLGDIGDNDRARGRVQVFRVPEPALDQTETAPPQVFHLSYADGPQNAEAMFAADDRLFIITKDRIGALYRSPTLTDGRVELPMDRIGHVNLAGVSDAEASYDGRAVVVRTSRELAFYRTADLLGGGQVEPAQRVSLAPLREPQGEGVAWGPDGLVYLASEGGAWNRAGRLTVLRCNVAATRPLPSPPAPSAAR